MTTAEADIIKSIAERNHISTEEVENILNSRYSEEELRKMNLVSQLRLIGRVKGVKSPTSRNMDELIMCILGIQDGSIKPVFTAKGRGIKYVPPDIPISLNTEKAEKKPLILNNCYTQPQTQQTPQEIINIVPPIEEEIEDSNGQTAVNKEADITITGILEIMPEGYGFLRTFNFYQSKNDVYVGAQQIKRFNLRQGDQLLCTARFFDRSKSPSLIFIHSVNDVPCDRLGRRPYFNDFEATYPNERICLEKGAERYDFSLRAIDLVAPIGLGQRGLIVAPPKTGKTTLLKKIAQSVTKSYGDKIKVFILLIDERPEEVTDFKENVPNAEVVFSTFDQTPFHHTAVAEMLLNNCKHRVEQGQDVLILLDSITRLARAYNKTAEVTGRTLTGGLDIAALETPKAFFGSARRVISGGSLTILATALVETGSRMDDIIYEEFKGTGNMEIHLDRELSDRRIFPAIDLRKSSTRREEMLLSQKELEGMWLIRRKLSRADNFDACLQLMDMITCTATNDEFIDTLKLVK